MGNPSAKEVGNGHVAASLDQVGAAAGGSLAGAMSQPPPPGAVMRELPPPVPYLSAPQASVNRSKGNKTEISKSELAQRSAYCRVSGRDMDLFELSAFGNVRREPDSGGCKIQ